MKKFIILALAAAFCLAFALPATAAVKMGGLITFDMYYVSTDQEYEAGGVAQGATTTFNDRDEVLFNVYTPINYLKAEYASDDGTYGGRFTVYMGRKNDAHWDVDGGYNYIWWKPMPDVRLTLGNQDQIVGGLAPAPFIGGNEGEESIIVVAICYGNIHTSTKMGVTANIKINEMVSLELGMYDPDDDGTPAVTTIPSSNPALANANEENTIPRFDIGLPIKWGNFTFKPKASWVPRDFDQVAANSDDDYDVWALSIDGSFKYGPLTLSGEYTTAENLSDANHTGGWASNARTYVDNAGFTRISDCESDLWWLNLKWQISPQMALDIFYGELENDQPVSPMTAADDRYVERTTYGARFQYHIAPNFIVFPHVQILDQGDDNLWGVGVPIDNGKNSIVGLLFYLIF